MDASIDGEIKGWIVCLANLLVSLPTHQVPTFSYGSTVED